MTINNECSTNNDHYNDYSDIDFPDSSFITEHKFDAHFQSKCTDEFSPRNQDDRGTDEKNMSHLDKYDDFKD